MTMITIPQELEGAVTEAGDAPIELADSRTGVAYVLVRADAYREMRQRLEDEEDRREQEGWDRLARRAYVQWARENPY